ncbi:MAG: hypothetical protein HC865_02240 [Cyanobacteria bacterium RU_5_0]|nr:hypothetical protein [Cyanobacteria bacterium RU_5_0]
MTSVYRLQQLNQSRRLTTYPTFSPIVTLQTILDQIQAQAISIHSPAYLLAQPLNLQDARIIRTAEPKPAYERAEGTNPKYETTVWDLQGKKLATLIGYQGYIQAATSSLDGQLIATTAGDCSVRIWNLEGRQIAIFQRPQSLVNSIEFSPNSKFLIVIEYADVHTCSDGSRGGGISFTARLFDLQGKQHAVFTGLQPNSLAHANFVQFSPQGDHILTLEQFSPEGDHILTLEQAGAGGVTNVRLWNLQGKLLSSFKPSQSQGRIDDAQFSPDGKSIAFVEEDGRLHLQNLQVKDLATFQNHLPETNMSAGRYVLRFSPDGQRIATGNPNGTIQLWDLQGQLLQEFKGYLGSVTAIRFSPDGQQIATVGKTVVGADSYGSRREYFSRGYLWNLQGQRLGTFPPSTTFWFRSDGKQILSPNSIWHLQNPYIKTLGQNYGRIDFIQFNRQGNLIATYVALEGVVRIWDNNGKLITALQVGLLASDEAKFAIK